MLNVFRQRQTLVKVVFGVILFLVVVSMAITLIPGLTGGDSTDSGANAVVAEVAGDKITSFEVQQSLQQVSQRNRIPSEMMPFYSNQILNQMILEKASLREASRLGLSVSQSELRTQLRQDPNFFPNGNFVGQQQYEDMISERFGMTVAQFEERYRQALLLDELRELVTESVVVTPEEVHEALIRENEKAVLDYVFFDPAEFKKSLGTPSDSELEAYYKSHKEHYQAPEKRSVKILLIASGQEPQAAPVSEENVKKYYQDHLEEYRVPERVMVRHILLKADSKDPAKLEQARKKAEDLEKQLKAGADFATLAKKYSEDTSTAPAGGLLNWVIRKQTVPEFEKVAFSLQPNTISDPVQTVYGIHIINVLGHEQPHVLSLDSLRAIIKNTLEGQKDDRVLADRADQAAAALERSPADIESAAKKFHGEVLSPPPFAQNEKLPRIGESEAFMQEVFGLEKGRAGPSAKVADGYAVPVLVDVLPPHPAEFAEVKDTVKNDYLDNQAKEKAISKAKELAKILEQQGKKDLKKAAKSLSLTVKTSPPVTRDGTIPSLGNVKALDPKTFSMPVGEVAGPLSIAGGQVVYQVESRESPKEEDLAGKKTEVQARLLNQKRQVAFDVYQDSLKNKLLASGRVKIHQDALAQLSGAAGSKP